MATCRIFVEGLDSNTSLISISGVARRNASQNDPPGVYLHCVALEKLKGTSGREYMIITYGKSAPLVACTSTCVCVYL